MISYIIKRLVEARKAHRLTKERKARAKHNWQQAKLMVEALNERDY